MTQLWKTFLVFILSSSFLKAGVYETLEYGDSKQQVTDKLMECERIENTVPETMFGRVGLNGTFKVKKPLGGLQFSLYFDWDEEGGLKEITLRSDPIETEEYQTTLKSAFENAASLVEEVYGAPIIGNTMPNSHHISDGVIINSHLWHVEKGSLLMGVAHTEGKYHLSIRYTKKRIEPVEE